MWAVLQNSRDCTWASVSVDEGCRCRWDPSLSGYGGELRHGWAAGASCTQHVRGDNQSIGHGICPCEGAVSPWHFQSSLVAVPVPRAGGEISVLLSAHGGCQLNPCLLILCTEDRICAFVLACVYVKQHFRCSVCVVLKHLQYKLHNGRVAVIHYSVAGDNLDPLDPSFCLSNEKLVRRYYYIVYTAGRASASCLPSSYFLMWCSKL